jgi:hypothetical protein
MRFIAVAGSLLILTTGHVPLAPLTHLTAVAIAAAAGNTGGQGVSGRPQKNGTIKAPPKPNASINGSQKRGKH